LICEVTLRVFSCRSKVWQVRFILGRVRCQEGDRKATTFISSNPRGSTVRGGRVFHVRAVRAVSCIEVELGVLEGRVWGRVEAREGEGLGRSLSQSKDTTRSWGP
jgi:hypothetical protein